MAFKFVHAADLHLDSPFVGLAEIDGEMANSLREATFQAFNNIIDVCIKQQADFLLVAGDVYDGAERSLHAQLVFRDGLRRLSNAGIHSFVVHGNHDPLDGWSSSIEWPERSYFFREKDVESIPFQRNGETCALIYGVSFAHRDVRANLASSFKPHDSRAFHIGLLHCNVGTNTGHEPYAPCTIDDLLRSGMDYWALGHIHARSVQSQTSPVVAYAGNSQGRHINESGPRGCYLVAVSDAREITLEFIATDSVRWARHEISIEGLETEDRLLKAMETSLQQIQEKADGRLCICRLTISGRGAIHHVLRRPGYSRSLVDELRGYGRQLDPSVWVDSVEVQTRPPVDIEVRRQSQDILGDCLRLVTEYRNDPLRRTGLLNSLRDLYDGGQFRKSLELPEDDELLALLDEAEALCLDRLQGEDDE